MNDNSEKSEEITYTNNSSKKIYMDNLFPKINNINTNDLVIDDESISYITTPNDAKQIANFISKHIQKYKPAKNSTIVDATGCVGGDTIALATVFGSVISIEIDSSRYEILKHNINKYGFKNVITINGNSIDIISKISYLDAIYIDPPWGGKSYKTKENLRLYLGDIEIETFILNCFDKEKNMCSPKVIALKIPKNYDMKYLYDKVSIKYSINLFKLKKFNLLIIEES